MLLRTTRWISAGVLAVAGASSALAEDTKDQRIQQLEVRVQQLEAELAALKKPSGEAPDEKQAARRARFVARMNKDQAKYSVEQIREAEQLYQVANRNWRSDEAKASLATMIEKYPDMNRTGCAILYLGQMAAGEEQEKHLRTAIEKHGDCMYGDGVEVGAFARYLLAGYYAQKGDTEKAAPLIEEIRAKYADAIDHRGRSLVSLLDQRAATQPAGK